MKEKQFLWSLLEMLLESHTSSRLICSCTRISQTSPFSLVCQLFSFSFLFHLSPKSIKRLFVLFVWVFVWLARFSAPVSLSIFQSPAAIQWNRLVLNQPAGWRQEEAVHSELRRHARVTFIYKQGGYTQFFIWTIEPLRWLLAHIPQDLDVKGLYGDVFLWRITCLKHNTLFIFCFLFNLFSNQTGSEV